MTTKLDIFAIAKANADNVQTAFLDVVDAMPQDQAESMREFARWVETESMISINVLLFVICEILQGGHFQNIYEWAQEQYRLCGRSIDDALRERLHKFYEKRLAFDKAFENGDQFRYGALNAGGIGLVEYNPYCIVLTRAFQMVLSNIALLSGDSLKVCFTPDGSFDVAQVQNRTAPHTHRHFLVAKERADEIRLTNRHDWARLFANSHGHYFEVIFLGEVTLGSIKCIRILKTEYDRMWSMAFSNFGKKGNEAERALIHDFVQFRRGIVDRKIQVEVVT